LQIIHVQRDIVNDFMQYILLATFIKTKYQDYALGVFGFI